MAIALVVVVIQQLKYFYVTLQDVIKGSADSMEWKSSLYIKTGCHRHCANGYIISVCHEILQDHIIIQTCDFMGISHSR